MINNRQLSQKCILIKKYFNFLVIFIYCLPKLFSNAPFLPCPPDFVSFLKDPHEQFLFPKYSWMHDFPRKKTQLTTATLLKKILSLSHNQHLPTAYLFGTVVCSRLPNIWSSLPVWDSGVYPPIAYLFVTVVCTQLPGIWSSLSLRRFYT